MTLVLGNGIIAVRAQGGLPAGELGRTMGADGPDLRAAEAAMTDVMIATPNGQMPAYVATPAGGGPWPGVVVVHDFAGMSHDLRLRNVAAPVPGWFSIGAGQRGSRRVLDARVLEHCRGASQAGRPAIPAARSSVQAADARTRRGASEERV